MNKFLALTAAAALSVPMSASAQDIPAGYTDTGRTQVCTIAEIQNDLGICSQVEMPVPAANVRVRIYQRTAGATTTNAGLGGLGGAAPFLAVIVGLGVIAAASGGSSSGTN